MTTTLFIQILNMSLGAAWAALLVILARPLLRRFSHCYSYALWGVVLFRLVCPVSFSSVLSLMPRPQAIPKDIAYTAQPEIESGFAVIDQAVNQTLSSVPAMAPPPVAATPAVSAAVNPVQAWLETGMLVWQAGMALLLLYGFASFLHFLAKLQGAVLVKDNIWESDRIPTAFVLGIFRPRVYLPTGLKETERNYVLCHEKTHIRRLDHIIKPFSLLLLTVHWFNPVLWLAWFLMRRDMEMSCDELALRKLGLDVRKDYSACLLNLSARQSGLAAPLAFGENDVKGRIVNILRYKKPALWGSVLAVALAGVLGFCLLSNPGEDARTVLPDEDSGIVLANLDDASGADQGGPAREPEKGVDLAIYQSPDEPAASLIHYTAPVRGSNMQVVKDPNRLEYHVDYGTPVYSPIRGTVEEFSDYSVWPYGKTVTVRSSENPDIILMVVHMGAVAEELKVGDQVDSSTQLGIAGATGNASFPTATVVVKMKTDGGESLAIPKEQWDAIFQGWRDGISGEPDPDPYTVLSPIKAACLEGEVWASPRELKDLPHIYEDLSMISAPSNGDRLSVAQMVQTLSLYFENVTAQDIIASGGYDYDPATDTILYNWEGARVIVPVLLNLTSWERKSGEDELLIIDYKLYHSGENPDTAASRRLTVKLLPDGSFRYLSNLEPGDPRNPN